MLASRFTPKTIWLGLALHLALLLGFWLPYRFGPMPGLEMWHSAAKTLFSSLAYSLALALNLEIAAEYPRNKRENRPRNSSATFSQNTNDGHKGRRRSGQSVEAAGTARKANGTP